jgi:hypothetical protein
MISSERPFRVSVMAESTPLNHLGVLKDRVFSCTLPFSSSQAANEGRTLVLQLPANKCRRTTWAMWVSRITVEAPSLEMTIVVKLQPNSAIIVARRPREILEDVASAKCDTVDLF